MSAPEAMSRIYQALSMLVPYDTGWDLCRLGGEEDGAYLVPVCIIGIERCFSPGVCNNVRFENDLARIFGVPSSTCDPEDIHLPQDAHHRISFGRFRISNDRSHDSLTLEEWVARNATAKEASLMLSMDIEGGEYDAFIGCQEHVLNAFRIITVELHGLHLLWDIGFNEYFTKVLNKLTRSHDILHMHPNNGTVYSAPGVSANLYTCIELTMLHKSFRLRPPSKRKNLGHVLDIKNVEAKEPADYMFMNSSSWMGLNI